MHKLATTAARRRHHHDHHHDVHGRRYDEWLVDFVNVENLADIGVAADEFACIDAVDMVRISSSAKSPKQFLKCAQQHHRLAPWCGHKSGDYIRLLGV